VPRIRSLKPEFWSDSDLADLPRDARLLYMGLWNLSDEHGRLRGDARYVKGQLFPYDDDLDPAAIDKLLDILDEAGKALQYDADGKPFIYLPTLGRHQRLEPTKVASKLPAPPDLVSESSQPEPHADEPAPDPDEPARDADTNALLYGSGIRDQGLGAGADSAAPSPDPPESEPPTRCDQHLKSRNPPNCGRCGDARREHGRWLAERTRRIAAAPKCRAHPGQPADNCGGCRSEELSPA
jgi:hypothetical protein